VDVAGLSRAENGKKIPAPETLASLADALDLPLADLYEAAGYPLPQQLPTLRPYLRRAYGVPDEAAAEIEAYLHRIAAQYGGGSILREREDELPD
jgi:transcriptional regulator with XRE-family HTH domain